MHYMIVGAGPAGVTAAETLRDQDPDGRVTLVGGESGPPYARMAIPYYLIGRVDEDGTYLRRDHNHYHDRGIDYLHGRVERLDPQARTVHFTAGDSMTCDRLLLATGASPVRPPVTGLDLPGVTTCWTLDDARTIARRARRGTRVLLLGAGFIGSIVLEALALRGVRLTVVETGDRMVPRMLDETAGGLLEAWCGRQGVDVRTGTAVTGLQRNGAEALTVGLSDGSTLEADMVVVSAGVAPNLGFLEGSGIAVERGVTVDAHFRTSADGVFAAGDVCQGRDLGGGFDVHAIQPTAVEHGRFAALNMAGRAVAYQGSLQMNVLDTLGLISSSFGTWQGVAGGDRAIAVDRDGWRYIRLEFAADRLVGAQAVGVTEHIGVLRGLIQSGASLGRWKTRLKAEPCRLMEAYLGAVQGQG